MFCPHCGVQLPENSSFCSSCGKNTAAQVVGISSAPVKIKTYLVESILVTLFCCLPFGIVAIVYASKANSCVSSNDIAGAQQASATAKKWLIAAFVVGLVSTVLSILGNIAA